MPITLPPISRRGFMRTSAALGAGALLPNLAWAEGISEGIDPNLIALFSDTHIDQNAGEMRGTVNLSDHLKAAVDQVMALGKAPAHTLVCGDCAYLAGDAGDYDQFVRVLSPLREAEIPIHCVLGNHDHRERFHEGGVQAAPDNPPVERKHIGIVEMERANWFMLDSLETTNHTPGLLGRDQLDWLDAALDAHSDKPALIMVHHTFDLEAGEDTKFGIKDGKALLDLLSQKRQAKAVFFGHSHTWKHQQREDGIHMVNLPPTAYVFQDRWPSGWVSCQLNEDAMRLTLHALDDEHPQHREVLDLAYRD